MVFQFVGTIALNAFHLLDSIWKCSIPLFLAILVLEHTRVYIHTSDGGYIPSYVETSVNKTFHFTFTLKILDVQLYNSYIQLWGDLDDTESWGHSNIVEDMVLFDDVFNKTWCNRRQICLVVWESYNFEVGLRLREIENFHSSWINIVSNFDHSFQLDILKSSVQVWNMATTLIHELLDIFTVHWNNDLFSWRTLDCHVNVWFRLTATIDDFLYIFDFLYLERWEGVFDLENLLSVTSWFGCLGIQFFQIPLILMYIQDFGGNGRG